MSNNSNHPFSFDILQNKKPILSEYDNHIVRMLSDMQGQFIDQLAYDSILAEEDRVIYEVYEVKRPEESGELLHGLSIVHPGKVGTEHFMTKGHFHEVLETAEIYYCLHGEGYMVMETPDGDCAVEPLKAQSVLYVPPCWAHRSVNTSLTDDLVTFFVYPAHAGHDYGSIEERGFRKIVVDHNGTPTILDNPSWKSQDTK
jgi:glucose-6-phosphate isomerase